MTADSAGAAPVGLTTAAARTMRTPAASPSGLADRLAQRLSEAIELGILLDGERLPPEAKLAEQFGVSTVTLREALAVLRGLGLVMTRRGRGGGTFVSAPDLDTGLRRRLRELSVAQLRDLGDHRLAVARTTARLAAERALPPEVAELERQLDRLRTARTPSDRRRAAFQLSVAVAAAAQSPRLLHEEQRLAAEVGDLLWLRASDADHAASVAARGRLIDAISRRDAAAAAAIAQEQVAAETGRLIGLRLRAYEADRGSGADAGLPDAGASLDLLAEMIAQIGAAFAELAAAADARPAAGGGPGAGHGGPLRRDDLTALRPLIFRALETHRDLAAGAGVITAPGVLADAPLWLEWWWTTPSGAPEQLRANLDPAAPDFYDYTAAPWYMAAGESGELRATGPYVDYFCTGESTITLSVPVRLGERFLGVAAADVLLPSMERLMMPGLLAEGRPVGLASENGRLIAATSAEWPPGLRVPPDTLDAPDSPAAAQPPPLQWRLAHLPDPG